MPHILTSAAITDPGRVRVVQPDDLRDLGWLRPGVPRADQQAFGARRLGEHAFILIPSVVSTHSWNLVFDPALARGVYETLAQEPFVLDPRLHSPPLPRGADGD
jgi:RES domain-containing protein